MPIIKKSGNYRLTKISTDIDAEQTNITALENAIRQNKNSQEFIISNPTQSSVTMTHPYEVGKVDVYLNGRKLHTSAFTATDGVTVSFVPDLVLDDVVNVVGYSTFTLNDLPVYTQDSFVSKTIDADLELRANGTGRVNLGSTGTNGVIMEDEVTGLEYRVTIIDGNLAITEL